MCRRDDLGAPQLWVTLVTLETIGAGTSIGITTAAWDDLADSYVSFVPVIAPISKGQVLFVEVYLSTPTNSRLLAVNSDRTLGAVLSLASVHSTTVENPYANGAAGFITVFTGPTTAPTAATSMAAQSSYTIDTLPDGLELQQTAVQRTIIAFNRPSTPGAAWVFYINTYDDGDENTADVFDFGGVSQWLYKNACINVMSDGDADFLDRLIMFRDAAV